MVRTPSNIPLARKAPAELFVKNKDFSESLPRRPARGGGQLRGRDTTNDLVLLFRLFLQNQEVMDGMEGGWATLLNKIARWGYALSQKNTIKGSRKNIALHYDLGNDFYELMLDPTMTYSCGIFATPETTLEEASLAKYDRIIDQLEIKAGHHLLEIGCGWGGFAHRLAERTDARLTATTISEQQYQYALERIRKNGWDDRIKVVKQDYRNLSGQFDRVVSIEMIEAVGHEYLPGYFSKISELLAPDGAALIQGITMPDHRYEQYLKEVDYIRTRVFPGSCVPSASAMIAAAVKRSDLRRPPRLRLSLCPDIARVALALQAKRGENHRPWLRRFLSQGLGILPLLLRSRLRGRLHRRHPPSPRQTRLQACPGISRMNPRLSFLIDFVLFQAAWFACVLATRTDFPHALPLVGFLLILGRVLFKKRFRQALPFVLACAAIGVCGDAALVTLGFLGFELYPNLFGAPLWMVALWLNLTHDPSSLFLVRKSCPRALIGFAVGGVIAYYSVKNSKSSAFRWGGNRLGWEEWGCRDGPAFYRFALATGKTNHDDNGISALRLPAPPSL